MADYNKARELHLLVVDYLPTIMRERERLVKEVGAATPRGLFLSKKLFQGELGQYIRSVNYPEGEELYFYGFRVFQDEALVDGFRVALIEEG